MPTVAELQARLARFESEHAVRACMNRYMVLCDALDASTPLDELAGLFTREALWEGKGAKYAESFGGYRGREAIRAMFATYMKTPAHFALNVHFLTSELIEVDSEGALGSWVMLQTSTFASGASHLNAARLNVRFAREDGAWRMAHFQTENLFSRPVEAWHSEAHLPVPDKTDA
ncbi:nuclear transport factor 2 family protein [Ectopseudomonas oleovorans]|uniref:Nuclear transport factor 2 family protein n=1 Tax=Ectopseudomonas oleovorans TaxID=301 RepID=A0AA42TYR8_ECTOL|nr:nuclear transport factor 2 family protein [Pseudomonas oleovorans]MDH1339300.1 nuclear transport factor 2 family protein [Pseudomonas oleovorans]MDH1492562.1 nuclear transport factor 2 family protein [Pseudomonas oleovorans]WGG23325.1 nuclear transport factor 2 family protein [Pseudomonas oleovorans]